MRIGAIKLYMPIFFKGSELESTSYCDEFINFFECVFPSDMKYMLSPNDLTDEKGWYNSWLNGYMTSDFEFFDYVFVFSSKADSINTDSNDSKRLYYAEVEKYHRLLKNIKHKKIKTKIVYVITDLACVDYKIAELADTILTQSIDSFFIYGQIEKVACFNKKLFKQKKVYKMIYIGYERKDRKEKFEEYFRNNPYLTLFGKFNSFPNKGPIPFCEVYNKLSKAKYTIIISDKNYGAKNFVTPRYYEAIMNNVIAFVDKDYNKYFDKKDFRYIKNRDDLLEKINILENDRKLYNKILKQQQEEFINIQKYLKEEYGDEIKCIIK